ncbi:flagellar export chaperone FlgN [Shouchella miscanthi]|uniref:flagellar export chaperone FlgN n=1 Tax=Shouchella miscanthi TaxID=2598861 RepID=UPI00119D47BD|nr:flagellar export chaperone FlgN [Shouchella miscanthi]
MSEALIKQMIEIQCTLIELAKQKENALIENHLEDLQAIVRKESTLVSKANILEMKMKESIDFSADHFSSLKEQLLRSVMELKHRNERNTLLIKDSLSFVKGSLQLFQTDRSVYTKEAKSKSGKLSIFDSQV